MADEPQNGLHETRINIEALSGEVNFLKSSQVEDRSRFSAFQTETRQNFDRLSNQFSTAIGTLGDKIEKQGRESAASRPKINDLITTGCAVGGFLAILGGALFYPVVTVQSEIAKDLKETIRVSVNRTEYDRDIDKIGAWVTRVQDNNITSKQFSELVNRLDLEINDNKERLKELDAQLIKRPEILAAFADRDERFTALTLALNQVRNIVDSISPSVGDTIKDLQASLRELRAGQK